MGTEDGKPEEPLIIDANTGKSAPTPPPAPAVNPAAGFGLVAGGIMGKEMMRKILERARAAGTNDGQPAYAPYLIKGPVNPADHVGTPAEPVDNRSTDMRAERMIGESMGVTPEMMKEGVNEMMKEEGVKEFLDQVLKKGAKKTSGRTDTPTITFGEEVKDNKPKGPPQVS